MGNLAWEVRENEGVMLQELIEGPARERPILTIKWGEDRRSGKFAGFCHVAMQRAEDAKWLVGQHGEQLAGRPMKIDLAADGGRRVEDQGLAAGKIKWRTPSAAAPNPTGEVRCFIGNMEFSMG